MLSTVILATTLVFCVIFFVISWRVKDQANSSFMMYAIGGGSLPLFLVLFSDLATVMGAGNFIGHASQGFEEGISHIVFVLGEQGSKIVFALVFAGFAGRFCYITISDLMYDLLHRDNVTKALTGILTGSIMLAWLAGQSKGLGFIFEQFTDINAVPVIIFFNFVFIVYTYLGGVLSVVWTDFIQGLMVLLFGALFYYFALEPVSWSMSELGRQVTAVAGPEMWSFEGVSTGSLLVKFVTGCFGVLAAQVYWQRCFAAKDPATARNGMLISGVIVVVMVSLTTLVGMVARALNPDLDPSQAMPWLMETHVPFSVLAVIYALVLAAAMSSADSLLNATAIITVNDIVRPLHPDADDQTLIKWTKRATIIIGVLATMLALYAESIIAMFAKAYTMAGGGIVPVLIVGLLWKSSRGRVFTMGERNSRLSKWGVRCGIISGALVSLCWGILWGVLAASLLSVTISLLVKDQAEDQAAAIP